MLYSTLRLCMLCVLRRWCMIMCGSLCAGVCRGDAAHCRAIGVLTMLQLDALLDACDVHHRWVAWTLSRCAGAVSALYAYWIEPCAIGSHMVRIVSGYDVWLQWLVSVHLLH